MIQTAHRQWLSPFMGVTFFAVSITGIILLFHHKAEAMNQIHQWGGILFIFGGVLHILLNWRVFLKYFQNSKAIIGACAGVLTIVLLVALFPLAGDHGGNHGRRGWDKGGAYSYDKSFRR